MYTGLLSALAENFKVYGDSMWFNGFKTTNYSSVQPAAYNSSIIVFDCHWQLFNK